MKNLSLEIAILRILNRVECGLREKTLQDEAEIAYDRPTLTCDDFLDSLVSLEDRGLVANRKNLIGDTVWHITPTGAAALRGV